MSKTIRILKVAPSKKPEVILIEDSLEALQREVEGPIESIPLEDDILLICNENGKLDLRTQPNRELRQPDGYIYDVVYGPFLIVGNREKDGFEFSSLTDEEVKRYSEKFRYPREGFRFVNGEFQVYEIDDTLGMLFLLDEQGHRKES